MSHIKNETFKKFLESTTTVEPVEDSLRNITVRIGNKLFRCVVCTCNVFHKEDKDSEVYICNSCDAAYEAE